MNIGIIGKGFVGTAVLASYDNKAKFYDPYKAGSVESIDCLIDCEAIYICVPTPQRVSGACDTSIVEQSLDSLVMLGYKGVVIAKSTAPFETYEKYASVLNLAFIPEFLRAATATEDYLKTSFMIIGCQNKSTFKLAYDAIEESCLKIDTYEHVTIRESCLIKYFENSYLAAKVSLFNEFYQLTEKVGCNWDNVVNGLTLDKRIEKDHTQVPGPDGQFGWGGHCFPKDTAALVDIGDKYGVNLLTLEAARKSNSKIRK